MATLTSVPEPVPDTAAASVPPLFETEPEISLDALKALSDGEVEDALLVWAGRVAAGEARLLAFLGEFDSREGWAGFPSCAAWLSWRLAIGPKAASEKVRVARALRSMPLTRATFERGELSYTQVRAVTRVTDASGEQEMLQVARSCSGEQIERLARGIRRAKALDDPDASAARYGVTWRYDEDGTVVLTARLPVEQAAVILAALDTCREQLERAARGHDDSSAEDFPTAPTIHRKAADALPDWLMDTPAPEMRQFGPPSRTPVRTPAEELLPPTIEPVSAGASRQQALLQMAQDWLAGQTSQVRRRAKPRLTALLDPLSGWARLHDGELLPPQLARNLSWSQFDLGRTRREVDIPLRQFLGAVDGERCRFPGCRHTRHLHAHHVIWWSHGGPTDLDNLVLLCTKHHQLVHDGRFTMTLTSDRTLTVRTAEGSLVPARPPLPVSSAEELDATGNITAETCPNPTAVDRLHLAYAVGVLMQLAA
jgi:uncharacterized protein DUF222/HNH endonuclease